MIYSRDRDVWGKEQYSRAGTHEQLLRMRGLYAQLVLAQLQND
jgi:hypothetical protein